MRMTNSYRVREFAVTFATLLALSSGPAIATDRTETAAVSGLSTIDLIKQRRDTMKDLGAHMRAVMEFIKGVATLQQEVEAHASEIKAIAERMTTLFPEGTGMANEVRAETGAKLEIWNDWTGFEAKVELLSSEAAKLFEVASAPEVDRGALMQQFMMVGKDGCSSCHESFRHKLPNTD